jgi:hypothetical protein
MATEQQILSYDLGKPWELNSLLTIGLTTRPLLASLRFFSWHSSHISLKGLSASIETLATVTWMHENSCKVWQVGIKFVQFQKNLSYHSVIKRTPYKAMFGVEAKVGLTSSSLPDDIISKISTEDDLKDITNTGFRND